MASFGRLTASAVHGAVDNTLALANFNFDFSLFKVAAPKEFEGVGLALSAARRSQAETGRSHVTARKLGALFGSVLPDTPDLIKAYGERASEIIQAPVSRPSGSETDGVFASHAGPDGTTIWAAATSGPDAIKVHLLACMLARIWNSAEATSIWYEIVDERKQEIVAELGDTGQVNGSALMAAQQEITRTQLSEWDASARAWIRTADQVKRHQQTQVEVIVKNLRIPVNTKPRVYDSVMQAWKLALEGTNRLIRGMPQQMQSGEMLLGLSSWHIYPDFLVVEASTTYVKQDDPLVHDGGVLTLGLEISQSTCEPGVHWSLPLAHFQYYGEPVRASRSIAMDGSRLTIDEFLQVVLGSVVSGWLRYDKTQKWNGEFISTCAQFIVNLSETLLSRVVKKSGMSNVITVFQDSWLFVLAEAAKSFLHSEGLEHQKCLQLINLGKISKIMPLAKGSHFGLSTYARYSRLTSNVRNGIYALRDLARLMGLRGENVFLRYPLGCGCFGYTTAIPHSRPEEPDHTYERQSANAHTWWIPPLSECCVANRPSSNNVPDEFANDEPSGDLAAPSGLDHIANSMRAMGLHSPVSQPSQPEGGVRSHHISTKEELAGESDIIRPLVKETVVRKSTVQIDWQDFESTSSKHSLPESFSFVRFAGKDRGVSLYIRDDAILGNSKMAVHNAYAGTTEMATLLWKDNFDLKELFPQLRAALDELNRDYLKCLKAIASMVQIYKLLPHTTISVRVLEQRFIEAQCLYPLYRSDAEMYRARIGGRDQPLAERIYEGRDEPVVERILGSLRPLHLNRNQVFSCIILLESGHLNLEPDKLDNVMAISAGNCIYVAAPLLCDPWEEPQPQEIRRIMGNVGRPGIALLVPPGKPKVRGRELGAWKFVHHREFDGQLEDHFKDTSLHLSFTGFSLPVDTGVYGGQDSELTLIESVVSLHERGKWVADLDILRAMEDSLLVRVDPGCSHDQNCESSRELTSLENWTEFLWRPKSGGIFRARGNWQARLAATTINIAQGYKTVVLSATFCGDCVQCEMRADVDLTIIA